MCHCKSSSTSPSRNSISSQSSGTKSILVQHADHDVPAFFKPQHLRPRTVAFRSRAEKIFDSIPKCVGRYDYRFDRDFSRLGIQDLFCGHWDIAFVFRNVLRGIFGADLDEVDEDDKRGFPLIDEFVAQIIIITNAPYCAISATLALLRQLRHKRQTLPVWMKEHEVFLAAFSMACIDPSVKPHLTDLEVMQFENLHYWEDVTRIHYRNIEWMQMKFVDAIEGFDLRKQDLHFIEEAQCGGGKDIIEDQAPMLHFCTCPKVVAHASVGYKFVPIHNKRMEKALTSRGCDNLRNRSRSPPPPPAPRTFFTPYFSISYWFGQGEDD